MSASPQKRTCAVQLEVSALGHSRTPESKVGDLGSPHWGLAASPAQV